MKVYLKAGQGPAFMHTGQVIHTGQRQAMHPRHSQAPAGHGHACMRTVPRRLRARVWPGNGMGSIMAAQALREGLMSMLRGSAGCTKHP